MATMRNRGLILALAGILLLLAATWLAYRPPAPRGPETAPTAFSAFRAQAILKSLVGDGQPHPIGSSANARVRDAIVAQLSALGLAPELQTGLVCSKWGVCGTPTNIVVRVKGNATENDAVLLAAHYDSVPAGPGDSDDGAGAAAVLEVARALKSGPAPLHSIIFLIDDGEEAGMLGARAFVDSHPWTSEVRAAVNIDARGTAGQSIMFETGSANDWV